MTNEGVSKDDVKVPEGDLGKEIMAGFDEGKDLLVTIIKAMNEEQVRYTCSPSLDAFHNLSPGHFVQRGSQGLFLIGAFVSFLCPRTAHIFTGLFLPRPSSAWLYLWFLFFPLFHLIHRATHLLSTLHVVSGLAFSTIVHHRVVVPLKCRNGTEKKRKHQ